MPSVLIVEDERDVRRVFRAALTGAGLEVREASDGLAALRAIETNPPDLIVLDLGLPMLNGHVVREQIQAQAKTRHIPIVIVTGTDQDLAGVPVACVLRKPTTPDQLVWVVRNCLQGSNGRR